MQISAKYTPTTRTFKSSILLLLLLMLFIYLLESSPFINYIDSTVFSYIIKPLVWVCITLIVIQFRNLKPNSKLKHRRILNIMSFNFGIIFIIVTILAGIIDGFGKSPYDHTITGAITNVLYVWTALIGKEAIRNYLVNNSIKKENYFIFILVSLLLTITSFPLSKYTDFRSVEGAIQFTAQYFIPELSQSIFSTYLVFLGGPITSIIYLSIIQGFHWLSPILPNLKWITTALIGILCPVFFFMVLQSMYLSLTRQIRKSDQEKEEPVSWIITCIISIGIIWFAVGVFPIYPSVIATGSMSPMIKAGDVILVKKIVDMDGVNKLEIGDIIQFKRDNILITHRIIDIVNDEKLGIGFKTKGDNNSGADTEVVRTNNIKGTIEKVIPKIGWPTLLIKSEKDIDLDKIIF